MKTTESVLREYIQFEDVNQSETIELLPLTIIDAMDEYANQQERSYSEEEVIELLNKREDYINQTSSIFDYTSAKQWFEQFKNK
jgi:hypothetical protein